MKKRILYTAIFTDGETKDSMKYDCNGYFYKDPYRILFNPDESLHIEIECSGKNILLKNNDSILNLNTEREVFNNYKLQYGFTHFKTRVVLFEKDDQSLKLKYELFDDVGVITTTYIYIKMEELVN